MLMKRAGETNAFICEASDKALRAMVTHAGAYSALAQLAVHIEN